MGAVSVTIEIAGLAPERIVFDISPLAELGVALHALTEPGHHPGLHGWATATSAGLKPDLADRLCEADFLWRTIFSDVFMPFAGLTAAEGGGRPGTTLAEDLDLLDRLDDERFVAAALEFTCASHYSAGGYSALSDERRRKQALDLAATRGPRQLDFTRRLLADPAAVRSWVRRLFEDCDEAFFADTWSRTAGRLAADARRKTDLLRRKGLAETLHAASPALAVDEDRGRITADKLAQGRTTAVDPAVGAGLTLVPTSFGWPHLLVLHAPGWRPVIHYPVSAPELTGPGTVQLLERRMEALAHPLRMRLCRHLARAAHTTGELAETCGITAPEVSRHLAVLKKAQLVTTRRRGRYVLHQLDVAAVARIGSDFLETVLR
ncbi:DUF5937 family protein [Streptomyces sanyensis]|uniref:DUF5937 family protein n=1 Tax=Streptomyces sanyensis TaxID=568869 RepID=A0ABP9AKB1_9ACTN